MQHAELRRRGNPYPSCPLSMGLPAKLTGGCVETQFRRQDPVGGLSAAPVTGNDTVWVRNNPPTTSWATPLARGDEGLCRSGHRGVVGFWTLAKEKDPVPRGRATFRPRGIGLKISCGGVGLVDLSCRNDDLNVHIIQIGSISHVGVILIL